MDLINSKISGFFWGGTLILLLIYDGGNISSNFLSNPSCLILILLVGVSHGALDDVKGFKVLKHYKIKNKLIFYLSYIFFSVFIIFIWIALPTFTLLIFLLIASYHFGKEDCWGINIRKSNFNTIKYLLKGSLIVLVPLMFSFNETISLFDILGVKNINFYNLLNFLYEKKIITALVATSILINLFIAKDLKYLTLLLIDVSSIIILYSIFSPLVSFTIYFCFLHSIRHFASLRSELNIDFKNLIKKSFKLTALTAVFYWIGLTILTNYQKMELDSSIINVIFIGLASLTFPHILLEYLLEKNEKQRN